MQIMINGISQDLVQQQLLSDFLAAKGIAPERVVVEINRLIVKREHFVSTTLNEGDSVEIIRFVGGG